MAGYGFTNNRGNFNTFKAMERHMDGNPTSGGAHRPPSSSYAHHGGYPAAGESFLSMKDNVDPSSNNNIVEQDLFEKVRTQMTQLNYRRKNWWVKPSTGKNNGEYDHKQPSGLQTGKYNFYAAQGGAQRFRFGAPAAGDVSAK
nr:hypothetical protein Iba_chr10cCG7380 [Ipomoea batatas]